MARGQTLADHSFCVAMLARELCTQLVKSSDSTFINKVTCYALTHDLDEVYNGDVPTPAKEKTIYTKVSVESIVKAADLIDTYRFVHDFGVGRHAKDVQQYVWDRWIEFQANMPKWSLGIFNKVMNEVMCGDYRWRK